jgi:hypothetical protein
MNLLTHYSSLSSVVAGATGATGAGAGVGALAG